MNAIEDRRVQEGLAAWEQRRIWRAFLITSGLLAFVYPLANFAGAPPGTEPLRLRLAFAAGAIALCGIACAFPVLRRYARYMLAAEIVAFYSVQGSFLALTHFSPYVVSRAVLVLSAVPLVAPTLVDVSLAIGTFVVSALVVSLEEATLGSGLVSGPFGTVVLACIIAGAVGVATIASRRGEIRARLAVELGLQDRLAFLRTRDKLTGLPNFQRFTDLCEDAIESAYARGTCFAVIAIDIDRLNQLDSQYGTRIVSGLVVEVARRLESRAGTAITCRIRSQRFVVVAVDTKRRKAEELAYDMLDSLSAPFTIDGTEIYATATAGIALYPDDGTTVDALLARCDENIRRARGGAHDAAALVSGEAEANIARLRGMRDELHNALVKGEYRLLYQPCVNSRTGRISGAEALLRWENAKYGVVAPDEFIPLLEADGLIAAVGEWVLREAVTACARWRSVQDVDVSVNMSLEQFRDAALCARVQSALADAQLPPGALILELTESVAVQNIEYTLRTMDLCRSWGVKFALDDFGTGYSSMAHLKDLRIDEIKIDRSFIAGLPDNAGDASIVRAIVSLGHSLGYTVVAEGVEHAEQARWLSAEGCDMLQGNGVSPPLSSAEFLEFLQRRTESRTV